MFKRLMIGLLAVGLIVIFIAEAANAHSSARRRSVEMSYEYIISHEPGEEHLWEDAVSVESKLLGVAEVTGVTTQEDCTAQDGYWDTGKCYTISCQMTGTLVCEGGDCTPTYQIGINQDSFSITLEFREGEALGVSVLDPVLGATECLIGGGTYADYLPNRIVVLNEFYFDGSRPPLVALDMCPGFTGDLFNCVGWWNSVNGLDGDPDVVEPMPKVPCCGEVNTLNVVIEGQGTVESVPAGIIDCPAGDCSVTYDGNMPPYDGCPEPEITLTASPVLGWEFIGWSGGGCSGAGDCTVTAEEGYGSVTAEFWPVLTVETEGIGTVTSVPDGINCTSNTGDCSETYAPATTVTLSALTDPGYVVEWSDNCTPITESECQVTPPATVEANFTLKDGVIILTVTADATGGARVWIQNPNNTNFTDPAVKYCKDANDPCIIDTTLPPFDDHLAAGGCIVLKRKGGAFNEWLGLPCEGFNNSVTTCDLCLEDLAGVLPIEARYP